MDIYEPWKSYNLDLRAVFLSNMSLGCRPLEEERALFHTVCEERLKNNIKPIIEMISKEDGKKSEPSPALAYMNQVLATPKEQHKYLVDYVP